jgi:Ca2+-binding EF-hand superfamily protein
MTSSWFQHNMSFKNKFSVPQSHYRTSSAAYGECFTNPILAQSPSASYLPYPPSATYLPISASKTPGQNGHTMSPKGFSNFGQIRTDSQKTTWNLQSTGTKIVNGVPAGYGQRRVTRWPLGQIFMQFDTDGDGFLDIGEFRRALRAIGLPKRSGEKADLDEFTFKAMDTDCDGKLSVQEFDANMPLALRAKIEEKLDEGWVFDRKKWAASVARHAKVDLGKVFKQFDTEGRGTLSDGMIRRAFRALGLKKRTGSKYELDEQMFKEMDSDGDGVVSLKEFKAFLDSRPALKQTIIEKIEAGWTFDPELWSASVARHSKPDYSKLFKNFDTDHDGLLDFREMQRAFRAIGLKKRSGAKFELDKMMFQAFDSDGDGKISLQEFEENMPDALREKLDEIVAGGWKFDPEAWGASVARHAKDPPYKPEKAFKNKAPVKPRWPLGQIFMQFDTDDDGFLDIGEFRRALRAIGLPKRSGEKADLDEFTFKAMDTDCDGKLSVQEFDANMPLALRAKIEEKLDEGWVFDRKKWAASVARHAKVDLGKVFKQFDTEGRGTLSDGMIRRAFRALGLKKRTGSKYELDEQMFKEMDSDGDGVVSLKEFKAFLDSRPALKQTIIEKIEAGWTFDPELWSASVARHSKPDYSKLFKNFDTDHDGLLDFREMQRAFRAIGLKKRSGAKFELDKMMFQAFDSDGDGKISLQEFEENMPDALREKLDEIVAGGWKFDPEAWGASVARHAKDPPYKPEKAFM